MKIKISDEIELLKLKTVFQCLIQTYLSEQRQEGDEQGKQKLPHRSNNVEKQLKFNFSNFLIRISNILRILIRF